MEEVEQLLLARVGGAYGDAAHAAVVLREVDDAPVGESRDDEVGERREGGVVVEALVEEVAGLGEEAQARLRPLAHHRGGDEIGDAPDEDDVIRHHRLGRHDREDADHRAALAADRGDRHRLRDGRVALSERARDGRVGVEGDAVTGRPPVHRRRDEALAPL